MPNSPKRISFQAGKVIQKPTPNLPLPKDVPPSQVDFDNAFLVNLTGGRQAFFIPMTGIFNKERGLQDLLHTPRTVGIIINCLKEAWYVESEPADGKRVGIMVFAPQAGQKGWRSRKPVMSGSASINADKSVTVSGSTVYDFVSPSPGQKRKAKFGVTLKKGQWNITLTGEVEY
jgi:hypothetical protein